MAEKETNNMEAEVDQDSMHSDDITQQPNTDNEVGEIKQIEAPIHHSNVKLNVTES